MLHCADVCCVRILGGPILECTPESMECTPESILATPKYSEYIGVYSYVLRVRSYIGENWQVYSYVLLCTPMYSNVLQTSIRYPASKPTYNPVRKMSGWCRTTPTRPNLIPNPTATGLSACSRPELIPSSANIERKYK